MNIRFSNPAIIELLANIDGASTPSHGSPSAVENTEEIGLFDSFLEIFSTDYSPETLDNTNELTQNAVVSEDGVLPEEDLISTNEVIIDKQENIFKENQVSAITANNSDDILTVIKSFAQNSETQFIPINNVEAKVSQDNSHHESSSENTTVDQISSATLLNEITISNSTKDTLQKDINSKQVQTLVPLITDQELPINTLMAKQNLQENSATLVKAADDLQSESPPLVKASNDFQSESVALVKASDDFQAESATLVKASDDLFYKRSPLSSLQEALQTPNKTTTTAKAVSIDSFNTTEPTLANKSLDQDFEKVKNSVFTTNNSKTKIINASVDQNEEINTIKNLTHKFENIENNQVRVISNFQSNTFKNNRLDNNIADQISFKAINSVHNKTKITTFELDPANLGKIEIKFEESSGKSPSTTLKILTEKFTTFDSVSKTVPHIESILRDSGIKGEINIEMGLKDFNTPNFAKNENQSSNEEMQLANNFTKDNESHGSFEVQSSNYNGQLNIYI